jgi:hypothetical protein
MTIALYIIAGFFYITLGAFLGKMMDDKLGLECGRSRHTWEYCGHQWWNLIMPILWPALAPVVVGRVAYNTSSGLSKEARDERKRERELEAVRHEEEITRVRALAAENLDRELRALGKE